MENNNLKYCGKCKNFSVFFQDQNPIHCSCKEKMFEKLAWEEYTKKVNKICNKFDKV